MRIVVLSSYLLKLTQHVSVLVLHVVKRMIEVRTCLSFRPDNK